MEGGRHTLVRQLPPLKEQKVNANISNRLKAQKVGQKYGGFQHYSKEKDYL
jgi:hypothetical protein